MPNPSNTRVLIENVGRVALFILVSLDPAMSQTQPRRVNPAVTNGAIVFDPGLPIVPAEIRKSADQSGKPLRAVDFDELIKKRISDDVKQYSAKNGWTWGGWLSVQRKAAFRFTDLKLDKPQPIEPTRSVSVRSYEIDASKVEGFKITIDEELSYQSQTTVSVQSEVNINATIGVAINGINVGFNLGSRSANSYQVNQTITENYKIHHDIPLSNKLAGPVTLTLHVRTGRATQSFTGRVCAAGAINYAYVVERPLPRKRYGQTKFRSKEVGVISVSDLFKSTPEEGITVDDEDVCFPVKGRFDSARYVGFSIL